MCKFALSRLTWLILLRGLLQTFYRSPDPYLPSTDTRDALPTSLSLAVIVSYHPCPHSWHDELALGFSGTLCSTIANASLSTASMLQYILCVTRSVDYHNCRLVGVSAYALRTVVHRDGGHVKSAGRSKTGSRGEEVGIQRRSISVWLAYCNGCCVCGLSMVDG